MIPQESTDEIVIRLLKEKDELLLKIALLTAENKLLKWQLSEQD